MLSFLEKLSFDINRATFILLDNTRTHNTKDIIKRVPYWQKRVLFILFLSPYSPHLNIEKSICRKLKKEWLDPEDYLSKATLGYALNRFMADMGKEAKN